MQTLATKRSAQRDGSGAVAVAGASEQTGGDRRGAEGPTDVDADLEAPLHAFPTLRQAAAFLRVAASTLSRRTDLRRLPRGERDQTLAPAEVMRLAAIYRKRSLNEVAAELIELAGSTGTEGDLTHVEREVDDFFTGHERHEPNDEWFETARRHLPAKLYDEVERALLPRARPPAAVVGRPSTPTARKRRSASGAPLQVRS